MVMLSVLLLVSPLVAADRLRRMSQLQYTAKIGRKIICRQLAAVMISAFVLAVILIGVFCAIFYSAGLFEFWNHGVTSFLNGPQFLLPLTQGNLIVIMTGLAIVLSLAVACAAFLLSRFSRGLLSVIIKVIPVVVALNFINRAIIGSVGWGAPPFGFGNTMYRMTRIMGTEVIVSVLLLLVALSAALIISRRENRVDVE
jgi:uncharacterized membrane protein